MTAALVRVRGLTLHGRTGTPVAGIDLDLAAGECVALVGESGSGKSLTARALLGLTPAGLHIEATELRVDGTDVLRARPRALRRLRRERIGYVPQDALGSLDPLRRIDTEIGDRIGGSPAARRAAVIAALSEAGFPDPLVRLTQRPGELSGGLRQRALIAAALIAGPALIIADEPTTALDASVRGTILDTLDAHRARGAGLLLISHDLALVARTADRVLVLDDGHIVEEGPPEQLLTNPQHPRTQALAAAAQLGPRRGQPPVISARTPAILDARGVTVRFGARTVLDDASLRIEPGRSVGLLGDSGSGKTTLARVILGLHAPQQGTVVLSGDAWVPRPERERRPLRTGLDFVPQDPQGSFDPRWSVDRILRDAGGEVAPAALLERVGLGADLLPRRPTTLSGGQRQRVAIARALARRPRLLVLDEPLSALDASVQLRVIELIERLRAEDGFSLLLISHELRVIRRLSDDIAVLDSGRIVEHGPVADVLARPAHPTTQRLVTAARLDGLNPHREDRSAQPPLG